MYTRRQRALMAWKCCASFFVRHWEYEHYPVWTRRNSAAEPGIAWVAQFLGWPGPVGLGATPAQARDNLRVHFQELRTHRAAQGESIPRPGTNEPIRFAPSERIDADPDLLHQFVVEVLEFAPGSPVFLSDGSSLHDFGGDDEVERLRGKVRSVFGVETIDLEDALIVDILDRIRKVRA